MAIADTQDLLTPEDLADGLHPNDSGFQKLGDRISSATVARLEAIAKAGGRIYLEGVPFLDEKGQPAPWKLATLVGAAATQVTPKNASLILEDPWFFGTGRGEKVSVVQTVSLILGAPSMASVAKTEKGSFAPTGPRAVAKLADGSPGIVVNPLGKGEVVWCPFEIGAGRVAGATVSAPAPVSDVGNWRALFAGITDYLAPRLVELKGPGAADPTNVH